jgi:hypothetical protein
VLTVRSGGDGLRVRASTWPALSLRTSRLCGRAA